MDIKVCVCVWRGEGEGAEGGSSSFLPRLSLSRNAKWRGWWARHADPWHPAVQCKGKSERPFWRPSILANQSRPLANLTTSRPHPCVLVCGVWCVVCGVCVFRPFPSIFRSCIPPPPPSSLSLPCSRDRPFLTMNKCLVLPVSRPAFPCFFLILITLNSVRVPETCLWSGPGWYVCTCMCSVLSPPPRYSVCVCIHPQHRVYVCSRSWPHCRMDPTDGHLETQTHASTQTTQSACMSDAAAVPPHLPCACPSPSICSSFTHLSLLSKTPTVPLPPDCSPVHRAHFICPPDSIAGDPLDR